MAATEGLSAITINAHYTEVASCSFAGKTTLLRALMGAIHATGKAELGHVDLLALPAHRRAPRILLLDEPFEGLASALARGLGEVLANPKTRRVGAARQSNEVHVLDLLAPAYFIDAAR